MSELWAAKPLVIIFWRHFGCSCGIDRAKRLVQEYPGYIEAGGQVVVIAQGEPERTAAYAQNHKLPCTMLCSPDLSAYIAFDLLEGTPSQILFDAPDELLKRDHSEGMKFADARKADGRPPVDSPWQLPGEFVIDRKGKIRLAYRYNFCEDWPDSRVLVSAIKDAIWHP
jgi:peroxiredoxin